MLQKLDVVRIKNLPVPDDEYNGSMALAISEEYTHPKFGKQVVRIKIRDTLWAIEAGNVEKVSDEDKDAFIRSLDGNQLTTWDKCGWTPKLISGKDS